MQSDFSNALSEAVAKHVRLWPTRQETLCWLVFLILRFGTISLWRLAAHAATPARTDSVRRRVYRFFQFVRLDADIAARMVVELLGLAGKPWVLAIDRTNWDFGRTTINILMVSVQWRGVGVPLIWTLLPKAGNSSTTERADLLDRLRAIFPDMKIASLTGDRQFIGKAWMAYLAREKIPFTLRLRENQYVSRDGYAPWTMARHAQQLKRGERLILPGLWRLGAEGGAGAIRVRIVMLRLKTGELLALAASSRPSRALARYRERWTIETLFGISRREASTWKPPTSPIQKSSPRLRPSWRWRPPLPSRPASLQTSSGPSPSKAMAEELSRSSPSALPPCAKSSRARQAIKSSPSSTSSSPRNCLSIR